MRTCAAMILGVVVGAGTWVSAAVSEAAHSAAEAARSYGAAVRSCDMGWALDYMYPPIKRLYAEQFSGRSGKEADNARRIMGLTEETPEEMRKRTEAGMRALREHYVKMGKQMISSGLKIESFTVGEPYSEYELMPPGGVVNAVKRDREGRVRVDDLQGDGERSRLVVLPTVLVVSGPGKDGVPVRVERQSHIYAIRDEVVRGGTDHQGLTARSTKINKWYFVDGNTDINTLRTFFPGLPLNMRLPGGGERILR